MAEAKFDQAGNITNLDELTVQEVAAAYKAKTDVIFGRAKDAEDEAKREKDAREKAEKDLKALKDAGNPGNSEELKEVKTTVEKLELSERKRQFGYEHKLSPEEVDQVFKINPNPTKETLDDPFVAGGLKSIRDKSKLANNTPGSSTTSPTFGGKKWEELTDAEKNQHMPEYLASKKK